MLCTELALPADHRRGELQARPAAPGRSAPLRDQAPRLAQPRGRGEHRVVPPTQRRAGATPSRPPMRLTAQDASFLYTETTSSPMHGTVVAVLEGEVSFPDLFKHIETRLHLIPRYRERLAFVPFNLAHAKWVPDPDFKLENHVKQCKLGEGRRGTLYRRRRCPSPADPRTSRASRRSSSSGGCTPLPSR